MIVNVGSVKCALSATANAVSQRLFKFTLFNIAIFYSIPKEDENATVNGYFYVNGDEDGDEPVLLKKFMLETFKLDLDSVPKHAYFIQRITGVNKDFLCSHENSNLQISSEPVLIDNDYFDQGRQAVQFTITDLQLKKEGVLRLPAINVEMKLHVPNNHHQNWCYGLPLFGTFRPEDKEEFSEMLYHNEYLVTDFYFIRASKGANGYDIKINEIVDNRKNINNQMDYEFAVVKQIKIPAKYQIRLLFPNFFKHFGEQNDNREMFMLRSSVAKIGLSLKYDFVGTEEAGNVNRHTLSVSLLNQNSFNVYLCADDSEIFKNINFECISYRFMQFVPPKSLQAFIKEIEFDESVADEETRLNNIAKFFNVVTIFNAKSRKSKH